MWSDRKRGRELKLTRGGSLKLGELREESHRKGVGGGFERDRIVGQKVAPDGPGLVAGSKNGRLESRGDDL